MRSFKQKSYSIVKLFFVWLIIGVTLGIPIGLSSAVFLYALDYITNFREVNMWIIALLPLAGLLIGWLYKVADSRASLGNNLIFQEYFIPNKPMPWVMAPLILVTTLLTHLVGASAGREGTAVQIGAVLADRFSFVGKAFQQNRSLFLMAGVGAGFASLFGTPWAGTIFALEILRNKNMNWNGLIPALITSFSAYYVCIWTGAPHTTYQTVIPPEFTFSHLPYLALTGVAFGLTALVYIKCHHWFSQLAQRLVSNVVWRPFFGGVILFLIFMLLGNSRYMGLGLPIILESFEAPVLPMDFILKLLLTAFTLGFGFKGGEVTPLFFIGATLGNVLAIFVPLPKAFLAALGFISVFSGATKTFFACAVMGIELFGWQAAGYFVVVSFIAQLFSGKSSIYKDQLKNRFSVFQF